MSPHRRGLAPPTCERTFDSPPTQNAYVNAYATPAAAIDAFFKALNPHINEVRLSEHVSQGRSSESIPVAALAAELNSKGISVSEETITEVLSMICAPEGVTFDQVHGVDIQTLEGVKDALHQTLHPDERLSSTSGLLLYGPPGCGKTLLAQALASQKGLKLFVVDAPSLTSGTSTQQCERITALWAVCQAVGPSILFIDECDGCFKNVHNSTRISHIKKTWQTAGGGGGRCLIIGATNNPGVIDAGIMSRFGEKIEFHLPDADARVKIWEQSIHQMGYTHELSNDEITRLSADSKGWSGRDIYLCVEKVAMRMNRLHEGTPKSPLKFANFEEHLSNTKPSRQDADVTPQPRQPPQPRQTAGQKRQERQRRGQQPSGKRQKKDHGTSSGPDDEDAPSGDESDIDTTEKLRLAIANKDFGVSTDRSSTLASPAMKAYNQLAADGETIKHTRNTELPTGFVIVKVTSRPLELKASQFTPTTRLTRLRVYSLSTHPQPHLSDRRVVCRKFWRLACTSSTHLLVCIWPRRVSQLQVCHSRPTQA